MSKSTPVVEINANRYDSTSGQLAGTVEKISNQVRKPSAGGSIDGFARRSTVVAQRVHRQAQRSQTLVRSAVKRPSKTAHTPGVHKAAAKAREGAVDPLRFSRAGQIHKSMKISHFGHPTTSQATGPQAVKGELLRNNKSQPKSKNVAASKTMPSLVTSASHQQLERLLDLALLQADSHKQTLENRRGLLGRLKSLPSWRGIIAGLLAVTLLASFLAWQKVPQVTLKVAAFRAHINATMPRYVPKGYSFVGPVKRSDRSITIRFRGAQDSSRTFEVTQTASDLNSTSLAATMLPKGSQVQTSQVNGNTVYVYGQKNDAAWVSHGVAYKIKDYANLKTDQLLQIADSF